MIGFEEKSLGAGPKIETIPKFVAGAVNGRNFFCWDSFWNNSRLEIELHLMRREKEVSLRVSLCCSREMENNVLT
jgi:hypothetical protein